MSVLPVLVIVVTAATASPEAATQPRHVSIAVDWNEAVLRVAEAEDGFLTLKGLRTVTMMHLAMHDALANTVGRYAPYRYRKSDPRAEPVIAAAQAAYVVATGQYGDREVLFAGLRDRAFESAPGVDADRRARGIELGREAAIRIVEDREGDGWDEEAEYRWHPMAPGVYAEFHEHSATPQGFVFGSGWARARGFALTDPEAFRVPPPPGIDSAQYTSAFDEVKSVGRFQSMTRTNDQTHLALWWKDFAENSHNRLARDLVEKEGLDLVDATRLFALINIAIYDAYISSFENKFHFNHWRPYTAIRWAAEDGNPNTAPETTWTNTHRHTYAFPSYPSAHGTACAAAMSAFAEVFGDDYAFTMHIPMVDVAGPFSGKIEMHPPTRSFHRFSDAAMECALSRIYLGIHFRYDSIEGFKLGQRIGRNVTENVLQPPKQ